MHEVHTPERIRMTLLDKYREILAERKSLWRDGLIKDEDDLLLHYAKNGEIKGIAFALGVAGFEGELPNESA